MLQLKNIVKEYIVGDTKVQALKGIDISFRKNEFVSILGPSGGGKTTLLNIIGGLDQYTEGDLIINGKSTKDFKDRDWDTYRNHSVGFVFQSYNLIPHQSILSNVELALTLSGVGKAKRRRNAISALKAVGLEDQIKKRPNQLSGGQMQRVAIARALVNNPEILLADEPTGALDTETSVQVMDILKEVSKDRLVIMVTHNPELAEKYSTRIVKLRDGAIIDDSNEFNGKEDEEKKINQRKTSMSFKTALSLSMNNLMTKRGRTLLTAFAGSIGIIGIALILSLSNGVNNYIDNIQKDTMASYPITIEGEAIDYSSMISTMTKANTSETDHKLDGVYSNAVMSEIMDDVMSSNYTKNNLTAFKEYLDDENSEINKYASDIFYSYDAKFDAYAYDPDGEIVNTDGSNFSAGTSAMGNGMMSSGGMMQTETFQELLPGSNDEMISDVITDEYDVLYGNWPENYNDVVLILDKNNEITDSVLYNLGLLPVSEYDEKMDAIMDGEDVETEEHNWSYEDICNQKFYLVNECDYYVKNKNGTFTYKNDDESKIKELVENGLELNICGVIRPKEDNDNLTVTGNIGYTRSLTDYVIEQTDNSEVVKAQKDSKDVNVLNGLSFNPDDKTKVSDTKEYVANMNISDKAALSSSVMAMSDEYNKDDAKAVAAMATTMSNADESDMSSFLDQFLKQADDKDVIKIYDGFIADNVSSYDDVIKNLGVVDKNVPTAISIYTESFDDKESVTECISNYNKKASEDDQITYTDYVKLLMSSITTIVNTISLVLIAFVAVSLVVSSIMIGIITYISVLERTKEIGILRAIGASKRDISRVFNAETFIIGLAAGFIGVILTCILCIPINHVIKGLIDRGTVTAVLPVNSAGILILISVILTLIAGLFPARIAAKKDPVTALRTE